MMAYGLHRMRYRMSWTAHRSRLYYLHRMGHRMRHRIRCLNCFALGIRVAAFCMRVQAVSCMAVFLRPCIAHKSSRGRFGRSRRCIWSGSISSCSLAVGVGCSSDGSLTILGIFFVRHSVDFVDLGTCLDSNNIADFRFLLLIRLLFVRLGFGETVACAKRHHLPCDVLVELLVREVLVALEGRAGVLYKRPGRRCR